MCGITAFLNCEANQPSPPKWTSTGKTLESAIDESLDIIQHRGPDARGKWISPDSKVGMGHVRLSIVDLHPAGNQPFHDPTSGIHAVVNGELYEDDKHRASLSPEYDFQGKSDCEIIIALYKKYGISFPTRLRGEFAFVLWDEKRELLFAARDRFGIKSLYYTVVGGRVLVATEMKCFLAYGWKPRWCLRSMKENSWAFPPRTMFRGVSSVKPGCYLLSKGYEMLVEKPYWEMDYPDKRIVDERSEEEIILGVRERLVEAVRLRMRADVPLAVFLSGGIDSSAIAGIVAHLIKEGIRSGDDDSKRISSLKCFTVQFDKESGMDESDIAKRTAEHLGVEFIPVHVDEEGFAARFEDAVWHSETPCFELTPIARLIMAEAAHSQGIKVALTGEGSDEHFAGYRWFAKESVREPDLSWPNRTLSEERRAELLDSYTAGGFAYYQESPGSVSLEKNSLPRYTTAHAEFLRLQQTLNKLPFPPLMDQVHWGPPEDAFIEELDGVVRQKMEKKWHPLHTLQYATVQSTLTNQILRMVGDNIDMVHQVESRPPFLDHHLTEYVNNLPPSLKLRYSPKTGQLVEKYILREAVRPFVTEEIYTRKKHPFLGPNRGELDGPLHRCLQRYVTEENVAQLGWVDWEPVKDVLDRVFRDHDPVAFRQAMLVAQYVILSRRFGVEPAFTTEPEPVGEGDSSGIWSGLGRFFRWFGLV